MHLYGTSSVQFGSQPSRMRPFRTPEEGQAQQMRERLRRYGVASEQEQQDWERFIRQDELADQLQLEEKRQRLEKRRDLLALQQLRQAMEAEPGGLDKDALTQLAKNIVRTPAIVAQKTFSDGTTTEKAYLHPDGTVTFINFRKMPDGTEKVSIDTTTENGEKKHIETTNITKKDPAQTLQEAKDPKSLAQIIAKSGAIEDPMTLFDAAPSQHNQIWQGALTSENPTYAFKAGVLARIKETFQKKRKDFDPQNAFTLKKAATGTLPK